MLVKLILFLLENSNGKLYKIKKLRDPSILAELIINMLH